jgi:hypothetical protein
MGMGNDNPADVAGVFADLFHLGKYLGELAWHSGIDEGEAGYEIPDEEGIDEAKV